MTLDGFDRIAQRWSIPLRKAGLSINVKAVFTHCRPWVNSSALPGTGTCELADLLVVIDYDYGGSTNVDRRAVLIQAKLFNGVTIRLNQSTEQTQFALVASWPPFTFKDSRYASNARDFRGARQPGYWELSGEYGAISLTSSPRSWAQYLANLPQNFSARVPFGEYLANMAFGLPGFARHSAPNGTDDWSSTVDELLQVTAALPITKSSSFNRGVFHNVGFLSNASNPAALGAGSQMPPTTGEGDEIRFLEGPISTVHIKIGPS